MKSREHYVHLAKELLHYIGSIEPLWKERIDITRSEFSLDDLQILGAYVGSVLDGGQHTVVPRHAFFEPGFVAVDTSGGDNICPVCQKPWAPAYASQPVCSNACAKTYYGLKTAEQRVI